MKNRVKLNKERNQSLKEFVIINTSEELNINIEIMQKFYEKYIEVLVEVLTKPLKAFKFGVIIGGYFKFFISEESNFVKRKREKEITKIQHLKSLYRRSKNSMKKQRQTKKF